MSILTSPDAIIQHTEDQDFLFCNFAAHLDSTETIQETPAPTVTVDPPTGLNVGTPVVMAAPYNQIVQVPYAPSTNGTYDMTLKVATSNSRTINRIFVIKVRGM